MWSGTTIADSAYMRNPGDFSVPKEIGADFGKGVTCLQEIEVAQT
jgi:hypothetical protein